MRSKEEIASAIEQLKYNKLVCVPINFLGDDNLEKIDACLDVLENNLSEEQINKKYSNKSNEIFLSKWNSAMATLSFINEEIPIDYLLYPEKDKYNLM